MILALDFGNSQLFGGVFAHEVLTVRFRKPSRPTPSSDELGLFLRSVLRENGSDPAAIREVAICSVVPDAIYSMRSCCRKYFGIDPFILQAGAKTGLKIRYRNPIELGSDRIANAIAASRLYPDRDVIIVDLGTATTFDVVSADRQHLGGVILPGLRTSVEALEMKTARLPNVEIVQATGLVGRSTIECIQSGLYFGNLAIIRELSREIGRQMFESKPVMVIGTGGFSQLFEASGVFDIVVPELVLLGLRRALAMNPGASRRWAPPDEESGLSPRRVQH
jgi:type III pantothenate kinase